MTKIALKITPTETYFFGTENKNSITKEANYFLKSNRLPQQTTLLGAIRYSLLQNSAETTFSQNQIINKEEAANLIGNQSFNLLETEFNFGKIKSISSVFLIHNGIKYIPCPFINPNHDVEFKNGNPFIKGYDPKEGYEVFYTNGKDFIKEDDIFEEVTIVQNFKEKQNRKQNNLQLAGNNENDAFFKTQFYKLKENWSFGIQIELEDEKLIQDKFEIKMGGENKLFRFEKIQINELINPFEKFRSNIYYALIFISDAYADEYESIFKYGIIETIPFRYLSSSINQTTKYYNRSEKDKTELLESGLVELIKKGSIFYFEKLENLNLFKKEFENKYLIKTGFNDYITLNPKNN